jgi:hypothetical protein
MSFQHRFIRKPSNEVAASEEISVKTSAAASALI